MLTILTAVIPDAEPLPLPAPPWLLWGLLLLTFFFHLLPMNFVLGGTIIGVVERLRGGSEELTRWLARVMPTMIAAAITFGVAPLLFLQALYGRHFFTSSVLMAWFWFAVVPLLIVAYYGAYLLAFRGYRVGIAIGMAAIFLTVAFIYSNNMTLMLRADRFLPLYLAGAGGTHLNLGDATLVPRFLHMLLGALAVAGMAIAAFLPSAARTGTRWFLGATLANVVVGMWWLGVLPREVLLRFVGGNTLATIWLAAGAVAGFAAMVLLFLRRTGLAAVSLAVSLATMILARDDVRRAMMARTGFTPTAWIEPQWGVIAIFAVLLVAALATTIWMALLLRKAPA